MHDHRVSVAEVIRVFDRFPCGSEKHRKGQDDTSRSGFALLLVLWVTALISLLVTGVIVGARQYVQATSNIVGRANAEALADASVMLVKLAIAQTLSGQGQQPSDAAVPPGPVLCSFPDGALVALSLQRDEDRISLNTDTVDTIETLLSSAGAGSAEAARLAANIAEFRTVQTAIDQPMPIDANDTLVPVGRGLFETVMELDQVEGMRPALFRAVVPFLTVSTHATTSDVANVISVALAAPRPLVIPLVDIAAELRSNHVLVHAEVLGKDGGFFVRDAELSISASEDPVSVVEWRQGFPRYEKVLADAQLMHANHEMIFSGCYDRHD